MTSPSPLHSAFLDLTRASPRELDSLIDARPGPEPAGLVGRRFRGINILPGARLLGIRKFMKGFRNDPSTGVVEGYNLRVRQGDDADVWQPVSEPFGFFNVTAAGPESRHSGTTLLDYGASPRNPRFRPERLLRDFLVVPDQGEPGILLGKAYLAIGGGLVKVGWFVLEEAS